MTTHVYFYHAQALRPDNRIDMFSGIYRTPTAITNEIGFKRARSMIAQSCAIRDPEKFVVMNLSHIAAEG